MIVFQLSTLVKADRQLVVALPPEVPTGKIDVAITIVPIPAETEPELADKPVTAREEKGAEQFAPAGDNLEEAGPINDVNSLEDAAEMLVAEKPETLLKEPVEKGVKEADRFEEIALDQQQESQFADNSEPAETVLVGQEKTSAPVAPLPARSAPPSPVPVETALKLPLILGKYRLTQKLGQGQTGAVYGARQMSLARNVALKILSRDLATNPDCVQRFVQQANVTAKLNHRNILSCLEIEQAQGFHFLPMEYMDEGSAQGWLKKLGQFSTGDSLFLVQACCQGLHYAHELNVCHGNIKPSNILLGRGSEVKLADFGLWGLAGLNHFSAKDSLAYMAPELIRNHRQPDRYSDLYALGCVLYVLLTGSAPFSGNSLREILEAKEKGSYSPLRQINREVPEALEGIINKLLAVNPQERFKNCAGLLLSLENLGLAHQGLKFLHTPAAAPLKATPPPPPKKIRMRELEGVEGYWYAKLKDPTGQTAVRKVTFRQLLALVKQKSADGETEVSRSQHGLFRPLGSYPEFHQLPTKSKGIRMRIEDKAGPPAEAAPAWKGKMNRRQWLTWFSGNRKRQGLAWVGVSALVAGIGCFFLSRTFFFWRLKRFIKSLF